MRALTLTQPWAGLVASGIKLVENRPRSMIRREDFGKPFAIHASREVDESVFDRIVEIAPDLVDAIARRDLLVANLIENGVPRELLPPATPSARWLALSHITSAVIAVATIERAVVIMKEPLANGIVERMADFHTGDSIDLGDQRRWFFGQIGYVLRDVRALAEPVSCRGQLGLWTLPADVAARVEEQLR